MALSRSTLALLAAAAVGMQVGAAIVATRFVVGQMGPNGGARLGRSPENIRTGGNC